MTSTVLSKQECCLYYHTPTLPSTSFSFSPGETQILFQTYIEKTRDILIYLKCLDSNNFLMQFNVENMHNGLTLPVPIPDEERKLT